MPMTLHVDIMRLPDGTYLAKCHQHAAWKATADSYDELQRKAAKSLKAHHSRQLQIVFSGAWQ